MTSWTKDVLISPGENYFAFNLRYLNRTGSLAKVDYNKLQKYAYTIYKLSANLLSFLVMITTCYGTYTLFDDQMQFFTNLDKTTVGCSLCLRLLPLLFKVDDFRGLVSEIMLSGDKITAKCERQMTILPIVSSVVGVSLIVLFSIIAFTDGTLALYAWLPFDPYLNERNFLTATILICILFIPVTLRTTAHQCFVCSLLMYFSEQLQELQWRLRSLEYSQTEAREFRAEFRDIIIKHVRMISYSKQMNVIYKTYFLVHNLGITIELCIHAVCVSMYGFRNTKWLISLIALLVLTLGNTYVQFYFGNEMIVQGRALSLSAWEANWTTWPIDLQKDLLLLIAISQKELKLSAGGFSDISLRTYAQIIYNGYSVFTVLQNVI